MEMPDKCSECRFRTEYEFCSAMPKNFCGTTSGEGKPDWCPLKNADGWISVKDELPEVDKPIIYCAFGTSVGEGTYRGFNGIHHVWHMYACGGTHWDNEITHWLPLPEPPKEGVAG